MCQVCNEFEICFETATNDRVNNGQAKNKVVKGVLSMDGNVTHHHNYGHKTYSKRSYITHKKAQMVKKHVKTVRFRQSFSKRFSGKMC